MTEREPYQEAVHYLREHHREHRAEPGSCNSCDLWRAWQSQDISAVDEIIARRGERRTRNDDVADRARALRAEWGEAGWTARDLDQGNETERG